tara:strand:- start:659 stop:1606 length:948 start_codon:yes stop_codon:yes gene_type:complete
MNWNIFKMGNAILNYHKISPDNNSSKENDELSVSESKFRQQLIFLKKNYNLVSLNNLINFEKSNKFNICITFDDGYKDNLTYALPILKEFNVPATIYFVTKFFENEFSIWWRELEDYIWQNSGNIKFEYEKKKYDISIKDNSEKIRCYGKLVQIIKRLDKIEQEKFLSALTKTDIRKEYKNEFLSKEDLKLLNSNPLITIGAHTHNHLSLKNLKKNDCIKEIKKSKEILENLTGRKIDHFSYPYGTKGDARKREFKIVEELGFKSAVTTSVGKISKKNLFNLPRIHINENTNERNLKLKLSIYYYFYKKIQQAIK